MSLTKQIQDNFVGLKMDEPTHTYTYDNNVLPSVSSIIEGFAEEFDTDYHATRVANREGVPVEQIKQLWADNNKQACDFGSITHDFGERYAYAKYFEGSDLSELIPSNGHERAIVKYWADMPSYVIPVFLELKMFSKVFNYAGTCDILLYNTRTKKFILADYKTNIDIFKNFHEQVMLYPFQYLLDMPYNHYQVQLSLYEMILEEHGYEIEQRQIIWLLPDGTYKLYETKDFRQLLKQYLNDGRRRN